MRPDPYRDLSTAFAQIVGRRRRLLEADLRASIDEVVEAIQARRWEPDRADEALRRCLAVDGPRRSDAELVAIFALGPALRCRVGGAATPEYLADTLANLAVVLGSADLSGPDLATRLVRRAHTTTWRDSCRVRTRGEVHVVVTNPCAPDVLDRVRETAMDDPIDAVIRRLDLVRFASAISSEVEQGRLDEAVWPLFRDHRLRRAWGPVEGRSTATQRVAVTRAARRLESLVRDHLQGHAA